MDLSNVSGISLNGKTVESMKINGAVVWSKPSTGPVSISLSSDKNRVFFEDGDYCTLSATVTRDGAVVKNYPVSFYINGELFTTKNTDNTGVASVVYNSEGAGELNIHCNDDEYNHITIQDIWQVVYDTFELNIIDVVLKGRINSQMFLVDIIGYCGGPGVVFDFWTKLTSQSPSGENGEFTLTYVMNLYDEVHDDQGRILNIFDSPDQGEHHVWINAELLDPVGLLYKAPTVHLVIDFENSPSIIRNWYID